MCSKIFGKGTLDSILGDVVGGGLGFIAGGPLGAAVGAGVGGAAGEALGGGSLLQDIQAGGAGAALAGGVSTLADSALESGLSAGTGVAAGVAGDVAGDVAGGVVPAAASEAATAAPALAAAPGLISDAAGGATIAESAPLVSTYAPAVGLSAASEAAPTADAALGLDLSASPGASFGAAATPTLASDAAGGATVVEGAPLTSTYGPVSAFDTGNALGAGAGGAPLSVGQQVSNFFSPVTDAAKSAGDFLTSPTGKLLSAGVSGVGLARNLMTPNNIPGESQLQSLATQLGQQGAALEQQGAGLVTPNAAAASQVAGQATGQAATLENYLTSGTLPPAVQTALDQATNSAITDLKASYAARGESADPNSNSELAAGIASLQQNAIISGGTLAASLYSQGVGLDQLASGIYTNLVGAGTGAAQAGVGATQTGVGAQESVVATNTAQNTAVNNSIANLSAALGGGSHAIVNGNTISIPAAA